MRLFAVNNASINVNYANQFFAFQNRAQISALASNSISDSSPEILLRKAISLPNVQSERLASFGSGNCDSVDYRLLSKEKNGGQPEYRLIMVPPPPSQTEGNCGDLLRYKLSSDTGKLTADHLGDEESDTPEFKIVATTTVSKTAK